MPLARQQHRSPDEPAPLRAVVWLRVSTEEQSEGAGLPRQRESARRVAEAKGYEVVEIIEVIDVSGTSTTLAPEMQRLVQMAESGQVDVVIVSEMSRLLRPDDLSSLAILDSFKRAGVLIDVGGSVVDFASPEGFLTGGIQAILGGHERMQMLRKMMQSKEERRRMGKCPGSAITLPTGIGYDRKKEEWHTTDQLWPIQEAFRLLHEGQVGSILEAARAVGVNDRTLANQLRNPIYKGIRVIDTRRDLSVKCVKADGRQGDRPKMKRAPDDVIRVRVFPEGSEPVDPMVWDSVNKLLDQISMAYKLKVEQNAGIHLLSGLGRCGYCSQPLYTKKRSGRGGLGHYVCACQCTKNTLPRCKQPWNRIEGLEELTLAFVGKTLSDDKLVADIIGESDRRARDTVSSFPLGGPDLEKQMDQVKRRERRLMDAYEGGAVDLDELKERKGKLAEERARIRRLAEAQRGAELDIAEKAGMEAANLVAKGARALEASTSDAERKELIKSLFSEIYFRGESIIAFTFAPGLLPPDGGESFAGIAHGLVSLGEPFCLDGPKEPAPQGLKCCTRCGETKPVDEFHRKRTDGGDGGGNRVAGCKACKNAQNAERRRGRIARETGKRGTDG